MKGLPDKISTLADIDHLRSHIGTPSDTPKARAMILQQLQAIRNTHYCYKFSRVLTNEAERTGPEPDYRILPGQGIDHSEIHEFAFVENPGSRLIQIGITLEDLDLLIAEIS